MAKPTNYTCEERAKMIQRTLPPENMSIPELAAYYRKKGLYVEQVKDWSKQCLQANADTNFIDPVKIENELKEEKNRSK